MITATDDYIAYEAMELGATPAVRVAFTPYYWPNGVKMLEAETAGGALKPGTTAVYRDEDGKSYSDKERPKELIEKSKSLLERWERGEI